MTMRETRVLHLSDLHVGVGFDQHKWDQIKRIFSHDPPDLVIVTGDVVNHPFFFSLNKASAKLREFKAIIADNNDGQEVPVWYIPGNHDTRIYGLVPINMLYLLALAAIVLAVWEYFHAPSSCLC